jgi:hypothetical protein
MLFDPDHSRTLSVSFRALGAFRALALKHLLELYFSDLELYFSDEEEAAIDELSHFVDAAKLIAQSMGLPFDAADLFPTGLKHYDEISEFFITNTLIKDSFHLRIREHFGERAAFNFQLAQSISISSCLASVFHFVTSGMAPRHRRAKIAAERGKAIAFFEAFAQFIADQSAAIEHECGPEFSKAIRRLARVMASRRWTRTTFDAIQTHAREPLNAIVPHYPDIEDRRTRAKELINGLERCRPGRENWREYEEICIQSLRFLFVPPFRKVEVQARTNDKHERRDGILPNNQFRGFWSLVRHEFDCKHVVCEFKNNADPLEKDALNQLRIYLSKPTIGRFGLMFHRGDAGASGLQARRNAYEQSRILVLLVTDAVLVRLLGARVYLGSADAVLEDLKSDFEVHY